jgi:NCS1 family nucleobase:cation symporter-1
VVGWIYLLPGFAHAVTPTVKVPAACTHLYYLAYPLGFTVSFLAFWAFNTLSPPPGQGVTDETDIYGTFTEEEAAKLGIAPPGVIESHASEEEVGKTPNVSYAYDQKSV